MATIRLLDENGVSGDYIDEVRADLNPDLKVSYFTYVLGTSNVGPGLRYQFGTAKGSAFIVASEKHTPGAQYRVEITGKWKDVIRVRERFEEEFGFRNLTPKFFNLPDLADTMSRIRWMLNWFRTGNK